MCTNILSYKVHDNAVCSYKVSNTWPELHHLFIILTQMYMPSCEKKDQMIFPCFFPLFYFNDYRNDLSISYKKGQPNKEGTVVGLDFCSVKNSPQTLLWQNEHALVY